MTRILVRKKDAVVKSRTALYMDEALHLELEAVAEEHDVSLNALCVSVLEDMLANLPAKQGKKKRKAR